MKVGGFLYIAPSDACVRLGLYTKSFACKVLLSSFVLKGRGNQDGRSQSCHPACVRLGLYTKTLCLQSAFVIICSWRKGLSRWAQPILLKASNEVISSLCSLLKCSHTPSMLRFESLRRPWNFSRYTLSFMYSSCVTPINKIGDCSTEQPPFWFIPILYYLRRSL